MEDRERVGIGTVVMRNKQYLAAIRPLDGVLAMSTMRFADEVVPRADVDGAARRRAKPEAKALKMATQLVDSLAADWKPAAVPRHLHRGAAQARSRPRTRARRSSRRSRPEPTAAKVVDLMAALEASVEAAKGRRRSTRRSASRKSSRSRRRTATTTKAAARPTRKTA